MGGALVLPPVGRMGHIIRLWIWHDVYYKRYVTIEVIEATVWPPSSDKYTHTCIIVGIVKWEGL